MVFVRTYQVYNACTESGQERSCIRDGTHNMRVGQLGGERGGAAPRFAPRCASLRSPLPRPVLFVNLTGHTVNGGLVGCWKLQGSTTGAGVSSGGGLKCTRGTKIYTTQQGP